MTMAMAPDRLRAYAEAIVTQCLDIRAGETLLVDCEIGHRDLAVGLADAAYRQGAGRVDVAYSDRRVHRSRIVHGGPDAVGDVPAWAQARLRTTLTGSVAVVRIVGDDEPGVLADVDPVRLSEDFAQRARSMRWFSRAVISNRVRWAVAAWPTEDWAASVYPRMTAANAVRRLGDDLLRFCRLGPDDPPCGWVTHAAMLQRRARTMTRRNFRALRFRGPGTDLLVGLATDGVWLGGGGALPSGRVTYPNFPTEEVFTTPVAGATSGTFRCTTPLSFNGRVIDGISGSFRGGRLERIDAARPVDQELLAHTFATDPGAGRLGEVALVDGQSRVGQAGRIYGETLLDENAASHIAFGNGFGETRSAGGRINRSVIHIDVMIGSDAVSVHGIGARGREVPVLVDGEWLLP